jgi:hypothetical protein
MSSDPLDGAFATTRFCTHILKAAGSLVDYHDIRVLARAETISRTVCTRRWAPKHPLPWSG